jgi:hypothetical protein
MDITKSAALLLQALAVSILGLNFAGVRADTLPRILQPLFLIPWYLYVLLFAGLLVVVITQKEKIRQIGSAPPAPPVLQKVDAIPYQGVTWDIVSPARHPRETPADYARRLPMIGEARIPPKCAKCGVELEEKEGWIYGYVWRCIACGFSRRNRDKFFIEAGRAEKIWRAKAEANAAAMAVTPAATATTPATAAPTVPKE